MGTKQQTVNGTIKNNAMRKPVHDTVPMPDVTTCECTRKPVPKGGPGAAAEEVKGREGAEQQAGTVMSIRMSKQTFRKDIDGAVPVLSVVLGFRTPRFHLPLCGC